MKIYRNLRRFTTQRTYELWFGRERGGMETGFDVLEEDPARRRVVEAKYQFCC
jgi:hypothetical protein